jgi:hypothetical protein
MKEDYITVKIKRTTLEDIRILAEANYRSIPQQIECMTDAFSILHIKSIDILSHPDNANPVPLVTIGK